MNHTTPIRVLAASVVLAAAVGIAEAQAPQSNHLYDRFQVGLAFTRVQLGPTIRIDASDGSEGTEFSTDDLGSTDKIWEPRLSLRWRPGRRHELEVGYLLARTSGGRVLVDTFAIADTTFAAGLRVNSAFKADNAFLGYRFAFRARERSQIGVAVGLGALLFNGKVDGVAGATQGGADTAIVEFSRERGITAPIASLGLFGRWRSGESWYIEADARGLYVPVDRITIRVVEANGAVRYFPWTWGGLELGYSITGAKVTVDPRSDGGGFSGLLKFTLQNLRLAVVATL